MHETLPFYCETMLNSLGTFPAEPVNTITSFVPVVFGVLALLYVVRQKRENRVAFALAVLTILTGIGSIAWHASRTEITLILDALPGLIYFAVVLFFWAYYLGGRYLGLALVAGFVALMVLMPPMARSENQLIMVAVLAIAAGGLLFATWSKRRGAFPFATMMVGCAVVALTLRTLDLSTCNAIPVGTHFFWHIFLGIAAYAGVRMMSSLKHASGVGAAATDAAGGRS